MTDGRELKALFSLVKKAYLKVVVAQAAIIHATLAAAALESGVLSRMGRGHLCRAFRRDTYRRE